MLDQKSETLDLTLLNSFITPHFPLFQIIVLARLGDLNLHPIRSKVNKSKFNQNSNV